MRGTRLRHAGLALVLAVPGLAAGQARATSTVTVRVTAEQAPIERAVVRAGALGTLTSAAGTARLALPPGPHLVIVSRLGYVPDSIALTLGARDTTLVVELEPTSAELEAVIVMSARGARRIEEEPTRVEVLSGDDVAEKTEMRPADLTKFLVEMPGVRLQQTSAASGAAAVRIQGLRPRYTLLLADGLPLYGGTGGAGLDLLQLPPADLRQIEVVKGPASALYGASALGGTINLVSKRPAHEGDLLLQGTSQAGTNAFGWISRRVNEAVGYTGVVGLHRQARRDMDGDGWDDLPGLSRVEARPRLFLEGPNGTSLFLTAGGTVEDREGGARVPIAAGGGQPWEERTETRRGDAGVVAHRLVGRNVLAQLRGALNVDHKARAFGTEEEEVRRSTGFVEASLSGNAPSHDVLGGLAVQRDAATVPGAAWDRFAFTTLSAFAQDAWRMTRRLALTASLRLDDHSRYGAQLSPRASLLVALPADWSARASASRGWYAPTPFVEETEPIGVRHVQGFGSLREETADYGALDLTGRTGPVELNATVFASRVRHAVQATTPGGALALSNAPFDGTTSGLELFAVYDLDPLYITALYAYTDARESVAAAAGAGGSARPRTRSWAPYAPRQGGGVDITWEEAERGTWIAVEAFYTGRQRLADNPYGAFGSPYTSVGVLLSQRFGPFKAFFNIENLTGVQQTDYAPLLLPSPDPVGRRTVMPWAPIEGRVLSFGVRRAFGS